MMSWQQRRSQLIDKIVATLEAIEEQELELDEKKLVFEISEEYNCSTRTAREYLKVGLIRHGIRSNEAMENPRSLAD